MIGFWDTLQLFEKIFWFLAVPSTILLIIQLVMTLTGFDFDSHSADLNGDLSIGHGGDNFMDSFHPFTVKNFIIFFSVFGWTGIVMINSGFSNILTIIFAVILGIISMLVVTAIFFYTSKLAENGSFEIKSTLNQVAEAYLPIPANAKGKGKIHVNTPHGLKELNAITKNELIKTGEQVKIIEIINNDTILVEKS